MYFKKAFLLIIVAILIVVSSCAQVPTRLKRQSEPESGSGHAEQATSQGEGEPESGSKKEGGVSLGKILGLVFLACCIIYCIGISWKVYKVCKGTYVEEEPVFLKYK